MDEMDDREAIKRASALVNRINNGEEDEIVSAEEALLRGRLAAEFYHKTAPKPTSIPRINYDDQVIEKSMERSVRINNNLKKIER